MSRVVSLLIIVLVLIFAMERTAQGKERFKVREPKPWCLMAWEPNQVRPHCIRTFKTYKWCMFDLKTMVDENKLVPIRFSCHRENVWKPLIR